MISSRSRSSRVLFRVLAAAASLLFLAPAALHAQAQEIGRAHV